MWRNQSGLRRRRRPGSFPRSRLHTARAAGGGSRLRWPELPPPSSPPAGLFRTPFPSLLAAWVAQGSLWRTFTRGAPSSPARPGGARWRSRVEPAGTGCPAPHSGRPRCQTREPTPGVDLLLCHPACRTASLRHIPQVKTRPTVPWMSATSDCHLCEVLFHAGIFCCCCRTGRVKSRALAHVSEVQDEHVGPRTGQHHTATTAGPALEDKIEVIFQWSPHYLPRTTPLSSSEC
nr:uncharacterized protein LOC110365134 [Columba livia]